MEVFLVFAHTIWNVMLHFDVGIAASMLDHVSAFCGWTVLDDANARLSTAGT